MDCHIIQGPIACQTDCKWLSDKMSDFSCLNVCEIESNAIHACQIQMPFHNCQIECQLVGTNRRKEPIISGNQWGWRECRFLRFSIQLDLFLGFPNKSLGFDKIGCFPFPYAPWCWYISYICPKNHPNVGEYTIHGAYGIYLLNPNDVLSKIWLRETYCVFDVSVIGGFTSQGLIGAPSLVPTYHPYTL